MNAITKHEGSALTISDADLMQVLQSSLYPGAAPDSIRMVLGYCKAAGLDPMQKPVHIVPMWDNKAGAMRDVVMPGVGLYRTQAARSGCAGIGEPDFGPDKTENIGGLEITFPAWCRVTVRRRQASGEVDEFTAREFWMENYAVKGGKEKSIAPNAMWTKRPYGQLAKCAEAQALRKAFPEIGSQPTAEEMDGKSLHEETGAEGRQTPPPARPALPIYSDAEFEARFQVWATLVTGEDGKTAQALLTKLSTRATFTEPQRARILSIRPHKPAPDAVAAASATPAPNPTTDPATAAWVSSMNAAEAGAK